MLDAETQVPLPGAAIVVEGTSPLLGGVTDLEGIFRIDKVKVGRHRLRCTYLGYQDAFLTDIQVNSGKETMVTFLMQPSLIEMKGVEIKAFARKEEPLNPMATLSARQLNMEEANRYAGGFDDPSRLASAFAGVASNLSSNGIVIRGNSPRGMLWQLEGVPVNNPNHFSEVTTFGGGGITALSSQVITHSDFFTGAFPAEYGNALSGVFDLKMRTGNPDRQEFTVKAGTIGMDVAAEGPVSKKRSSTYLVNYRYSTLAIIAPLLPDNGGSVRYQDLSFKTQWKAGRSGTFSLWGLGSADGSGSSAEEDSTDRHYTEDHQEVTSLTSMGAIGSQYKHIFGTTTLWSTSLSLGGNKVKYEADWLLPGSVYTPAERVRYQTWNLNISTSLQHRFNAWHSNRTGISTRRLFYDIQLGHAGEGEAMVYPASGSGLAGYFSAFSQSRIDLTGKLKVNLGLYYSYFTLNRHYTVEPRAGIQWKCAAHHHLSLAYGMHSQMEILPVYFIRPEPASGVRPNLRLPFSKARHLVAGWDWALSPDIHLKTEVYYQYLFHIPVIEGSSFSMLNLDMDWYLSQKLESRGLGRNTGLDVTLEKYMKDGFYYLFTASLFESRYRGGDGVWRDTRYDKRWVVNLLGGKEWKVGKEKNDLLGLNGRINFMGGDRMTPVDEAASLTAGEIVYDESRAFSVSKPNVYYVDLTLNYTRNKKRHASTWSVQLINLLAQQEFNGYRYNLSTRSVEEFKEVTMVPNISYKIDF